MSISYAKFRSLLHQGEKSHLDFKLSCDAFASPTLAPKAELAKDICAMANNGNQTSYIVIGVSDDLRTFQTVKNKNLTDDKLQDFAKVAVHPPPKVKLFRCRWPRAKAEHQNKEFVIIQVGPHAKQAFRLARDFIDYPKKLCLRRNEVWIRRSATSDLATPEEICSLVRGKTLEDTSETPDNTRYDRSPAYLREIAARDDLPTCLQDLKAQVHSDRTIVVTLNGVKFVWRCEIREEHQPQISVFIAAGNTWEYEHGILYIVLNPVPRSAFKEHGEELNFKERWGQFTTYSLTHRIFSGDHLSPPWNTTPADFPVFTLPNVRDTKTLRNRLVQLRDFLESDQDIYDALRENRRAINANLRRWLREGWLRPENVSYAGRGPIKARLKEDQVFDRKSRRVLKRQFAPDAVAAAQKVLDLSGWKYRVGKRLSAGNSKR